MNFLKKHYKSILTYTLLISGALAVVLGNTTAVQLGVSGILWSLTVFMLVWIANERNKKELMLFNEDAELILKDVAQKGENSEYFNVYNIEIINKLRLKLIKKHKKQITSFSILGVILLIIGIMCLI